MSTNPRAMLGINGQRLLSEDAPAYRDEHGIEYLLVPRDNLAAIEAELARLKAPASDEELVEIAAAAIHGDDLTPWSEAVFDYKDCLRDEARAVLAAVSGKLTGRAIPEGWKIVPVEPTSEMHNGARDWSAKKYGKPIGNDASEGCYRAMLDAAPEPAPALAHGASK